MKNTVVQSMMCTLVAALCVVMTVFSQTIAAPESEKADDARIPTKWFLKAKGYEEALELQKKTGADVFIYFTKDSPSNEKGLCKWFENKALSDFKIRRYLRNYIKVHVPLPSNPASQKLAEQFQVSRAPAVFIVQPGRRPQFCKVFDWSEGRPKLYSAEELIEGFRARSSARYQLPTGESEASRQQ